MTLVATPAPEPEVEGPGRRTWLRTLSVGAGLALVLGAVGGSGWWLTHPDSLALAGGGLEVPVEVGAPLVVGMWVVPKAGTVEVVRAQPRVVSNSADAALRVLVCRPAAPAMGSAGGAAEDVCDQVSPPGGAVLGPAAYDTAFLVLELTPQRPGAVHVDGLQVEYRDGLRRGSQAVGTSVIVRTKPTATAAPH